MIFTFFFHRYGVDLIHFTQNKTNVVHASTKENDIIRYLNVQENNYIRYFRGHNKRVVTLCMNPTDDSFLSGSLDKSIRLWDIRYATVWKFQKFSVTQILREIVLLGPLTAKVS